MNLRAFGTVKNSMNLRAFAALLVAVVMVVLGLGQSAPVAASPSGPPPVPDTIAVPAGSPLLFSRHAKGVQIYDCVNKQWTLHAPRAQLFDPQTHKRVGIHYGGIDRGLTAGPWWESTKDDSTIRGGNAVSAPSPTPGNIPWLRLEVLDHTGNGIFSPVSYIQRLNTEGGVAPTGACKSGAQRNVRYEADYYFYGKP